MRELGRELGQILIRCGIGIEVRNSFKELRVDTKASSVSTPQATPKHLTDEELKQQYGIHLASRLQEDGDGKEAKWADIDDDEDDWAPETIEWNDGTKINLAQIDHAAAIAEEQATSAALAAKEKEEEEAMKSKIRLAKPTSTVGPNATVLKLGSAGISKPGGLVLKAPSDKPTLVAKPSSTATVKSPWASLPPVEKVSPIPTNPLPHSSTPRFSPRDPHGFEAMPPPPPHTKEIAADDFSRSSRETRNGLSRELFNFQSGRYDPVPESRRGSIRKEQNFRAPALLQRPSQSDQSGPAEPSPAFQTSRSSTQELGTWNRRRTSSNVSGDSGNPDRRMSLGKPPELSRIPDSSRQQSRDSLRDRSPITPGLSHPKWAQRGVSPADSRGQSVASQSPTVTSAQQHVMSDSLASSPQQIKATPDALPTTSSVVVDPSQDPVVLQKKLMREKREAAIKRKKEEEEREDAEKRARIRQKMEQLGLTDEKMGKKVAGDETVSVPTVPSGEKQEAVTITSRSPPKPPLPDPSGTPQQYGLMKLHGPQPVNGIQAKAQTLDKEQQEIAKDTGKLLSVELDKKPVLAQDAVNLSVKGDVGQISPEKRAQTPSPGLTGFPQDSKLQSWKSTPQEPNGYAPWGSGHSMTTHSSPSGNLWAPLSHHRALGNGDFNPNMQRVQTRQHQYTQHLISSPPPPIGSPRNHQSSYGIQQPSKTVEAVPRTIPEHSQTIPTYPSPGPSPPATNGLARVNQPLGSKGIDHQLQPNLVASNFTSPDPPSQTIEIRSSGLAAWADFGVNVAKQEAEAAARWAEERRRDVGQEFQLPPINETWRQVKTGDKVGERHVIGASKSQPVTQSLVPSPEPLKDLPNESVSKGSGLSSPVPTASRSRFFSAGQAIAPHGLRGYSSSVLFNRSPSPPPPESADHPAYLGSHERPTVNIPSIKPKPTVKLPPLISVSRSEPNAIEVPLPATRAVPQPPVATSWQTIWQDRFNGLFDRKTLPEKHSAHVIDFSTSKTPLEITSIDDPAVITLPPPDDEPSETVLNDEPAKLVEEEDALFEERDFGSVPTVRIPNREPVPEWQRVKPSKFTKAYFKKFEEVEVQSIPLLILSPENNSRGNSISITVRLRGMSAPKVKMMSKPYNHNVGRPQQSNMSRGNKAKGPKTRESSGAYNSTKPSTGTPMKPPTQNSPSQNGRPKVNPNISWARKVSAGPV